MSHHAGASAEVERRQQLSYREFETRYMFGNKPVIVTDAIGKWRAASRWTPEFFKTEFGSVTFSFDDDPAKRKAKESGQNGRLDYTMSRFIDEVIASTDEDPAPYFRNKVLAEMFPALMPDIMPLPAYFQPNWLGDRYLVPTVGELLNRGSAIELYIGGRGGAFPVLHYDGVATHAFLMQIYGRKKFILYPPDQTPFLYPSPDRPNLSQLNSIDAADLDRFPLFANAVPTTFILEPGELAFIPSRWWHTTKMLTASISVSVNTVNQSNWRALMNYVKLKRRHPLVAVASQAYLGGAGAWRAVRDRRWSKRVRDKAAPGAAGL